MSKYEEWVYLTKTKPPMRLTWAYFTKTPYINCHGNIWRTNPPYKKQWMRLSWTYFTETPYIYRNGKIRRVSPHDPPKKTPKKQSVYKDRTLLKHHILIITKYEEMEGFILLYLVLCGSWSKSNRNVIRSISCLNILAIILNEAKQSRKSHVEVHKIWIKQLR